eukprot:scaffold738_cov124-Cylindrotheca_fusiformis.AAC.17
MDFEDSVKRLARDQKKIRGKRDLAVSEKAKRQAEYQRKQAARRREERERQKRLEEYQQHYMRRCDRSLQVKPLQTGLLSPTSIYGEGDKIALPPSVLETLTSSESNNNVGNPWTFRIGILNPDYQFPTSALIQTLKPPKEDHDAESDEDDAEDTMEAYRDELKHKYLAYTHCTVVEFTQDEGHIGIPQPIAKALLEPNVSNPGKIPVKRTVDPAGAAEGAAEQSDKDQTPGHLAWGAFDLPDMSLEISLLNLPKGEGCTLVPTKEAIRNNFYGLKDVKMVLEQSLIRTRATLSVGDVVSTWHRGVQFDLNVTKIIPSRCNAVTCINTDIEVEIGESEQPMEEANPQSIAAQSSLPGNTLGTGHTLGSANTATPTTSTISNKDSTGETTTAAAMDIDLLPEPPLDQRDGVCTIVIQHGGGRGKRRFLVESALVKDLFAYAASLVSRNDFRLVTRYPRRVLTSDDENQPKTLAETGIAPGQELFMMEFL